MNSDAQRDLCPCRSGKPSTNCCQPFLNRTRDVPTAEALMRSRYTAFVLQDENYLRYSWHPDNCPKIIHLNPKTQWLGLKIKKTVAGNTTDTTGEVEFIARSKINGKASRLHENSLFTHFENRWVYTNGKIAEK
jgi:SEC-C motif-containing protein